MKYKECIKKVGIKNVMLYEMFYLLELVINLPYLLLRIIAVIYDNILEIIVFICEKQQSYIACIFSKRRCFNLSKISNRIDNFRREIVKRLRG